ncbi:MAG: dihydrofolate reductase [Patescibacteria group bacterium]
MINLIAILSKQTRAVGKGGNLLWDNRQDLAHFKKLTAGHPVIMGRKTWESLPEQFRPLPKRTNIVVTSAGWYGAEGAAVAHSLPEALSRAKDSEGADEIFVIGGGEIYKLALPFAERLYLTLVDDALEGDTYFPDYGEFVVSEESEVLEDAGKQFQFVTFMRP